MIRYNFKFLFKFKSRKIIKVWKSEILEDKERSNIGN